MTTQGLSRIAGGIAIAAVLVVSGIVAWSVLRQQDPELAIQQAEAPGPDEATRLGDLTGYVGQVDPDTHTIVVAASPLGADPVMLVVADDASVTVHGKEGALGDLSKDMPVRVFYEVRNEVKHVTSIQVVADSPQASEPSPGETRPPAEAKAPAESQPAAEVRPVAEVKPAAEAKPAGETKATVETRPPMETRPPAEVKPTPPPVTRPAPPAPPVTAAPPKPLSPPAASQPSRPRAPEPPPATLSTAPLPAKSPRAAETTAPLNPPGGPAARPAERDDDGSAAVEWLFKDSGRR